MRVLVVNAGSSTLKLRVVDDADDLVAERDVDPWDGSVEAVGIEALLDEAGPVDAVGHRIVHGGIDLVLPTVVTADVEAAIDALAPLAPLHQPRGLAGIRAARRSLASVPQVACFDTAFHATLPPAARTYALPEEWREQWGLGRFGFHGLSHGWAASRGPEVTSLSRDARIVSCHLGSGASLCAVRGGRSVDTTMGFTPLDGIVMGSRSGAVDPGLLLWLMTDAGLSVDEVSDGLVHRSGLRGLSGESDMRRVLAGRQRGDEGAVLAFDVYVHRLQQGIAAMAASAEGLDLLVFTGGVGEHAAEVRAAAAAGLDFLGVAIDDSSNRDDDGDADISAPDAAVRTAVVSSREDLEIVRQVRTVLG